VEVHEAGGSGFNRKFTGRTRPVTELLAETEIGCPYCGETISILVDCSIEQQQYIEDCQVCCQPIVMLADALPGEQPRVEVRRDDES